MNRVGKVSGVCGWSERVSMWVQLVCLWIKWKGKLCRCCECSWWLKYVGDVGE